MHRLRSTCRVRESIHSCDWPLCLINSDFTVITGDNADFTCSSELDDSAPGDLVWYRNNEESSRTSGNVNKWKTTLSNDDNGAVFNCQLEHFTLPPWKWTELSCEDDIIMNVQYSPDVNITGENGSILTESTIEGASYSALCNVDANPTDNLNFKWEFQDNTVHNGALLQLQQVNRDQAGIYNCIAENMFYDGTKGYGSQSIDIDVQFPPSVEVMPSDAIAKEGTSLTLACNVIDSNPVDVEFSWILADGTKYDKAVVDIVAVTQELNGNQSCSATNTFYDGSHGIGSYIIYFDVQYIATINMSVQPPYEVMKGSFVRITCTVLDGNPNPYKLKLTLDRKEIIEVEGLELVHEINGIEASNAGYYSCRAVTLFFDHSEEYSEVGQDIMVKVCPTSSNTVTILFVISLVVFVPVAALIGVLLSSVYWKRKLQDISKHKHRATMDLKEGEDEHYTSISPRVESESVYMKLAKRTSLEISPEFLCLKETLAESAFGKVVKAEAWHIAGKEGTTNVVVKMLTDHHLDVDKRAFMRELDLMKSIGSHQNVVSLLGCCTEQEPLHIVLEFMEGGILQDYLRSHRSALGDAYANLRSDSMTPTNSALMSFAYQTSSGMEFMSSNECIHRNLTARNVLLDKHNVCKISDFVLASNVVEKLQYERRTEGKLPIRWMAIESLFDGTFTTKSDVWSFGVVLWEIVTMGNKPYPGMSEQEVTSSLREGYRMPKPLHCEQELYSIILSCWDEDPEKRPTFAELTAILKKMANDEKAYIKIMDINLADDD